MAVAYPAGPHQRARVGTEQGFAVVLVHLGDLMVHVRAEILPGREIGLVA